MNLAAKRLACQNTVCRFDLGIRPYVFFLLFLIDSRVSCTGSPKKQRVDTEHEEEGLCTVAECLTQHTFGGTRTIRGQKSRTDALKMLGQCFVAIKSDAASSQVNHYRY